MLCAVEKVLFAVFNEEETHFVQLRGRKNRFATTHLFSAYKCKFLGQMGYVRLVVVLMSQITSSETAVQRCTRQLSLGFYLM